MNSKLMEIFIEIENGLIWYNSDDVCRECECVGLWVRETNLTTQLFCTRCKSEFNVNRVV